MAQEEGSTRKYVDFVRSGGDSQPVRARNHVDQMIMNSPSQVHILRAMDSTKRWASYLVYVPRVKEVDFLQRLANEDSFDLEDYGVVIASCYGREFNDQVRALVKERFGWTSLR